MKHDIQLQHDVLAQLEWEPSVTASDIGVAAKDGVITLTGTVTSYLQKLAAEQATRRVYGVSAIANDLTVVLPGAHVQTDTTIATAAADALRLDGCVPDDKIQLTVNKGWITLEGCVEWDYQRSAAASDVGKLAGVVGVSNLITVKSHVKPCDITRKIGEAFKRSAEVDARRVAVESHDNKVVLKGRVRSWAERDEAQEVAWAAPGVSEVDNQLQVVP